MTFEQRCLASVVFLAPSLLAIGCSPDSPQHSRDEDPATEASRDAGREAAGDARAADAPPVVVDASTPPDASAIVADAQTPDDEDLALLGSSHARSFMDVFCEGKADDAKVPADPRRLIQPGFNQGKAVAFNAYWQDCHVGREPTAPQTCGQYRAQLASGRKLVQLELAPKTFGSGMPAAMYADSWKKWDGANLTARPADFDEQASARYGLPKAPFRNPYPLSGEDPNQTDGGSGQLPVGLAQLREPDGKWTGSIGMTCEVCHSSAIQALGDSAYQSGMGALTADLQLLFTDMAAPMPIGMNDSPGVTNAMGLSALIVGMFDQDSFGVRFDKILLLQLPGNTSGSGDTKSPPWWNVSHRPRKFWDGGFSTDSVRMDSAILNVPSAFDSPLGNDREFNHKLREKVENDSVIIQTYIESLQSPRYPWRIDRALAKQGSILFHTKDLWANNANPEIPRPPSNGSCAGCHGAYAPKFAQDPDYLADPSVAGMAGYVAPLEIIRTDPQRHVAFTRPLLEMMSTGWLSYPESSPDYISPEDKPGQQEVTDDLAVFTPGERKPAACTWQGYEEDDATGYLAPPLHGIWATGPYLHNASLPDIWSVLSPKDRPAVWRRRLRELGSERALDTSADAYDQTTLGWKYDKLVCGQNDAMEGEPLVDCEPTGPTNPFQELGNAFQHGLGSLNSIGYQVRQPENRAMVEQRKIFNTYRFAKSNGGHDFTSSLTDDERHAIIEYLKTL